MSKILDFSRFSENLRFLNKGGGFRVSGYKGGFMTRISPDGQAAARPAREKRAREEESRTRLFLGPPTAAAVRNPQASQRPRGRLGFAVSLHAEVPRML